MFIVVLLSATGLIGRTLAGWSARRAAARHIDAGEIAAAERCLVWAERVDRHDPRTHLLRAACFRQSGQKAEWENALASARRSRAAVDALNVEARLGGLRWGEIDTRGPQDVEDLAQRGVSPQQAVTAVVYGLLARRDQKTAEALIQTWAARFDEDAFESYLRGVVSWWAGQLESAQREFEQVLVRNPRHELTRIALAHVLEERYDLTRAHAYYAELAGAAPDRESARVDLSRVLRELGRANDARSVMSSLASDAEVTTAVAVERAQAEYECGDYAAARHWFQRAHLDQAHTADTLRAAAAAMAFAGDQPAALQLFARVDDAQGLARQMSEWQRRSMIDPDDRIAAEELARFSGSALPTSPTSVVMNSVPPVSALFVRHCAACHGVNGDGHGRAARHLIPRPRNLRSGRQRLISTLNGVPALDDIEQVIRRGMPGTAMPSFPNLSPDELRELARQVQQFRHAGIREEYLSRIHAQGDVIEEAELQQIVDQLTTPGMVLHVPTIGVADARSIARGTDLYLRAGCRQCHGEDGAGVFDLPLFDDTEQPTVPRDLVHDPMKGGDDAEAVYKRIRLGMPGTPHPAVTTLEEVDLISVVHYCLSLSKEPKRRLTNYQRGGQLAQSVSSAQPGRPSAQPTPVPQPE